MAAINDWIANVLSSTNRDSLIEQLVGVADSGSDLGLEVQRLRRERTAAKARLQRALDNQDDPDYPLERAKRNVAKARTKLIDIEAALSQAEGDQPDAPTADDYRRVLGAFESITDLLKRATPEERKEGYRLLGLHLAYSRTTPGNGTLEAVLQPPSELLVTMCRVGGGT